MCFILLFIFFYIPLHHNKKNYIKYEDKIINFSNVFHEYKYFCRSNPDVLQSLNFRSPRTITCAKFLVVEYDESTSQLIVLYQIGNQHFLYTIYNAEGDICICDDGVIEENIPVVISTEGLENDSYELVLTIGSYLQRFI